MKNLYYSGKKRNPNSRTSDFILQVHNNGVSNPFYKPRSYPPQNQARSARRSSRRSSGYSIGKMNVGYYDRYGCRIKALLYYPAKNWGSAPRQVGPDSDSFVIGHSASVGYADPETVTIWPAGSPPFADSDEPFPIIIYGPGLFSPRTYYDWMGELAARGIAVLIPDFVFNNGLVPSGTTYSNGLDPRYPNGEDTDNPYTKMWPDLWPWVYELVDSVEWIQGYTRGSWKTHPGNPDHRDSGTRYIAYPQPSSLFDLSDYFGSIYLAGHSTGATMGLVASSFDDRIEKIIPMASYDKGGVGVDWNNIVIQAKGPYPSDHAGGITEPVLFMVGEHDEVCPPCNNVGANSEPYSDCNYYANSYMTYNNIGGNKCHCLFLNDSDAEKDYVTHLSWCDRDVLGDNGPGNAYCDTVQAIARDMIKNWVDDELGLLKNILTTDNKISYVTNIGSLQSRSYQATTGSVYNHNLYRPASGGIAPQNVPPLYGAPKVTGQSRQYVVAHGLESSYFLLGLHQTIMDQIAGGIDFLEQQRLVQTLVNKKTPRETISFAGGEMPAYEWAVREKYERHNPFNCNFQTIWIYQSISRIPLKYLSDSVESILNDMIIQMENYLLDIAEIDTYGTPENGKVWRFYGGNSGMYGVNRPSEPDMDSTLNAVGALYKNGYPVNSWYPLMNNRIMGETPIVVASSSSNFSPQPQTNEQNIDDIFIRTHGACRYFLKMRADQQNFDWNDCFYTFFRDPQFLELNDIDSIVNSNSYWVYILLGGTHLIPEVKNFLLDAVDKFYTSDATAFKSLGYYQSCPHPFLYTICRNYFLDRSFLDDTRALNLVDLLISKDTVFKQQSNGSWHALNVNQGSHESFCFETALSVASLIRLYQHLKNISDHDKVVSMRDSIKKGISYLTNQYYIHKGDEMSVTVPWPWGAYFLNPSGQDANVFWYMGSDSLTTAFVLEAYSLYLDEFGGSFVQTI